MGGNFTRRGYGKRESKPKGTWTDVSPRVSALKDSPAPTSNVKAADRAGKGGKKGNTFQKNLEQERNPAHRKKKYSKP